MIKKFLLLSFVALLFACGTKPPVTSPVSEPLAKTPEEPVIEKKVYRSAYTKYFDLIHTRLNVSFDWKHKQLLGQAAIILRPHFYSTDSLTLNARGMELKEVALLSSNGLHVPLKYKYDSLLIHIHLDRVYSKDEPLTIFINYISKPEELPSGGSAAINSDKGLYFINADSLDPYRPTEVWTQGETESNCTWFPTIEDPAQKMTQEIYMTVDTAFTTLSNGLFISSVNNNDGTKTDYWKQSLPASPYLTMIAAGKYSVVKERWKNIEVSYYVDPPYEKYAHNIFGNTPEMLTYFSDLLGIPYQWEKFSQIVVHNYVSGAMENATAVVHGTSIQQNFREHADANFEDYISHELFHHWFGDLVTCESWSNIVLNEGFANYAEYLWREHKFGIEDAERNNMNKLGSYLATTERDDPSAIRYYYNDREDMFDAVSYNKGGRILHMLRNYVGDSAFFASLHDYLSSHMFSSAEIADLRLSFEKITGEDLNWFFDQWFMKGGHPFIKIDYEWNDSLHSETVTIAQKQDLKNNPLYKLPLKVDIYYNGKIDRKKIIVEDTLQKFVFDLPVKPDLVNVDADKILLCGKTDNKSNSEFIFQYYHAPLFLDRMEAVTKIGSNYNSNTPESDLIIKALTDRSYAIRLTGLNNIGELAKNDTTGIVKNKLKVLATTDSTADVREKALSMIGKYYSYSEFSKLYSDAINDTSYKVEARAFRIIAEKDVSKANELAPVLEKDSNNTLTLRLSEFYSNSTDDKTEFYKRAMGRTSSFSRYQISKDFGKYLKSSSSKEIISKGSEIMYEGAKKSTSKNYRTYTVNTLKDIETSIKDRISSAESEAEKSNDSVKSTESQASILEWKTLKNNLHDKIVELDK